MESTLFDYRGPNLLPPSSVGGRPLLPYKEPALTVELQACSSGH